MAKCAQFRHQAFVAALGIIGLTALGAGCSAISRFADASGRATEALYQIQPLIESYPAGNPVRTSAVTGESKAAGISTDQRTQSSAEVGSKGSKGEKKTSVCSSADLKKNNGVTRGICLDTLDIYVCRSKNKSAGQPEATDAAAGSKRDAPASPQTDTATRAAGNQTPPDDEQCNYDNAYEASIKDTSGEVRNRLRSILVNRSDLICSETEAQIVGTNDLFNFSLGSATTILAGVGALVPEATAAKALAGSAAMTNATRSQINEVFYANALKAAIIQRMDDTRTAKLQAINSHSIQNGKIVGTVQYSTEDMIDEVLQYHNACSFFSGVNGLAQNKQTATGQDETTKPKAPSIHSLSSADGALSVSIDVPTDGTAIVGYTAMAVADGGTKAEPPLTGKSTGVMPFVSITGCSAGTTYSVTVVAEYEVAANRTQSSPPSAAKTQECIGGTTGEYPPPTDLQVSAKDHAFTITFKAAKSAAKQATQYEATATSTTAGDKVLQRNSQGATTTVRLDKCTDGHAYDVAVRAMYGTVSSSAAKFPKPVPCK